MEILVKNDPIAFSLPFRGLKSNEKAMHRLFVTF